MARLGSRGPPFLQPGHEAHSVFVSGPTALGGEALGSVLYGCSRVCEARQPSQAWRFYLFASTRGILEHKFGAQDGERPGIGLADSGPRGAAARSRSRPRGASGAGSRGRG